MLMFWLKWTRRQICNCSADLYTRVLHPMWNPSSFVLLLKAAAATTIGVRVKIPPRHRTERNSKHLHGLRSHFTFEIVLWVFHFREISLHISRSLILLSFTGSIDSKHYENEAKDIYKAALYLFTLFIPLMVGNEEQIIRHLKTLGLFPKYNVFTGCLKPRVW